MRAFVASAVLAAGLLAAASSPSFAQFGVYVGPGGAGVSVGPPPPSRRYYDDDYGDWRVSRSEAIRIARRNGMAEIFDVDRTPHAWIVRGVNYRGRRVAMRIDRNGGWSW